MTTKQVLRIVGGIVFLAGGFFYHYAPTGPVLHRIILPFVEVRSRSESYQYAHIAFQLSDQKSASNVEDETDAVNAYSEQR